MWFFYPVTFCEYLLPVVSLCSSELCQLSLAPLVSPALHVVVFLLLASSTCCVVGPHGSHPHPSLSSLGESFVTCWSLVPCQLWWLSGVFGCCSATGFQPTCHLLPTLAICLSPCIQGPSRSPTAIPNSLIFLSAGSRLYPEPLCSFLLCSPFFPYFCLLFSLGG